MIWAGGPVQGSALWAEPLWLVRAALLGHLVGSPQGEGGWGGGCSHAVVAADLRKTVVSGGVPTWGASQFGCLLAL